MKEKWLGFRVFISVCLAIGWWDFWYPELTEAAGVYEVFYEENAVQITEEMIECGLDEYTFREWLKTDSGDIRYRLRIWDWFEENFDKG